MQKLTVALACLLGFLFVAINGLPTPPYTSTVTQPQNYTFQYTTVIGFNNTMDTGSTYISGATFSYLRGLTWFAQSNYSNVLGGPGLFACDSNWYRATFFNANNLNLPQNYNAVFGAPNATTDGDFSIYSIDYTSNGIYALDNYNSIIYFFNYSSINLAASTAYEYPNAAFGNYSSESITGGYYTAISDSYQIATKKSTGEIFVADYGCKRILVYPPTVTVPGSNMGIPSYAIGQNDTYQCGYYSCSDYSPTTCLNYPQFMAFDCYDGLWVYDGTDYAFYYFANNSKVSTFAFNSSGLNYYFSGAHGLTFGPGCNALTFLADGSATYVFSITYVNQQPVSVQAVLTFGSAWNTGTTDYTTTNSLGNQYGFAYGPNGLAYAGDYNYDRIVVFNLSSALPAQNSAAPSIPAGSSASATRAASNVAPSSTSTRSVSQVPLSSGASQTSSPTSFASGSESSSPVFGSEASASNTPTYFFTGASSQLSSWVNLF